MSVSEFDNYRPPEGRRRRGRRSAGRPGGPGSWFRRGNDGAREIPVVPDAQVEPYTSYYGRPVVKAPPWKKEIATYLFLGGVAGGSALLALGAQLTDRPILRRNARLAAMLGSAVGSTALIADLGRPERFLHMLRTIKPTSPMSLGSWVLVTFSTCAGVAAVSEVDRWTGSRLPLGPLRCVLRAVEPWSGVGAGLFGAPLAGYTAVLLSDTAMPTWNAAREDLPFVFVSSASLASGGLAMITTPVDEALPARLLALAGVAGDVVAQKVMESRMDPVAAEPLHQGTPGVLLKWTERLLLVGGLGTLVGGGNRAVAAVSGVALLGASACTRFGVFYAGLNSARDPRYTIEPQRRRLEARRAAGQTGDSITTVG
ncbi:MULTISPECIES: NrfD/PsrC family molybdoenzyme membrane anchor subunit [Kocuria]|uniref:Polysulfide reductase NrfD n=1 Tax=Kocuria subflava TaxID=1736139 RepID=A0A846TXZ1_9MICC|nr:NrfD/PsrC family molybdoenzyme membrane anchor subunit [Kocuria sp. CPCC 104605]NKE10612.1 polysulfide reductase NrfD [Kocuria subflava]